MKTKYFFLAGFAAMLASCANEEYIGDNSPNATLEQTGDGSIQFGFDLQNATRVDQTGATAASTLGNQFIVYGEKGESGASAATPANLVFQNYQVNYTANTAFTSTSNTNNWEYVGYTHSSAYQTGITTKDGTSAAVNALSTAQKLEREGYNLVEIRQHSSVLHSPTKLLQEKILSKEFQYTENKLLEINFQNAKCTFDTNKNRYVSKKKSNGKVDMCVSLINAVYLLEQDCFLDQADFIVQTI
jgi:hypothetical protein